MPSTILQIFIIFIFLNFLKSTVEDRDIRSIKIALRVKVKFIAFLEIFKVSLIGSINKLDVLYTIPQPKVIIKKDDATINHP